MAEGGFFSPVSGSISDSGTKLAGLNFEDIYDYKSYFEDDLEKIQKAIDRLGEYDNE